MNKLWYFSKCSLIFNLTLLLQFKLYLSLSTNHFGDCVPKKCGNLYISYPFYVIDEQNSYCGYPGFEIFCKGGKFPHINISGVSYMVKNVSYEDQTLQVVNSVLMESIGDKKACFGSLENLNLKLFSDVFKYSATHDYLYLLLNCTQKVLQESLPNMVVCGAVGVYRNESRLKDLEGKCRGGMVSVPYEGVESKNEGVKEMLEDGFGLKWTANNCSTCTDSGGQCGYDHIVYEFNCYCQDRNHANRCPPIEKKKRQLPLILGASTAVILILILIALVICAKGRITFTGKVTNPVTTRANGNQNVEAFRKIYGSFAPKRYRYADIRLMTNSFKHKLGEGGCGTVYKGKLPDGRLVAIKKLKNIKGNGEEFINEVVSIGRTNHVNVVSLLGYCFQGNNRALVYEFMTNGSLEKFICRAGIVQQLPPETLLGIAVGVAKGLDYLHRGCNARILHFDIKPHNILLDQDFCPKISDFGLAKVSETKNSMTSMLEARGTIGYIAPEVFCRNFGGVSHKSDVYSYGMMVLDMACGRKNLLIKTQNSSEQYFPDWIYNQLQLEEEVGVHEITDHNERGLSRKMILVGLWCIQTYPSNRPSMNRVVEMLEGNIESIQMPPSPQLCSPPRSGIVFSSTIVNVP